MTNNDDEPSGVGGWLAFLVVWLAVLWPLLGCVQLLHYFSTIERDNQGIEHFIIWSSFKTVEWIFLQISFALSIYGGIVLATKRTPGAVFKAKLVLWFIGPISIIATNLIIPMTMLHVRLAHEANAADVFFVSLVIATVWTAYLNRSKRVKNTYGLADKPTVAQAAAEKGKPSGTKPLSKPIRWAIFAVVCCLALVVYAAWKDLDRLYGWGFPSAFLRGAVVLGGLLILWDWAKGKDGRPAGKSVDNQATSAATPLTTGGREHAMAPTSSQRPSETVQAPERPEARHEERFYRQIAEEFARGTTDKGMWTRLFAECGGDEKQTEVLYIRERADSLILAARQGPDATALEPAATEVLDEDAIYRRIAEEFETGTTDVGLWTRVFAQCGGDERNTEVLYIRERAQRLILAELERLEQPHPPLTDEQEMEEHDITFDGERYAYGEYRYDKLSDAVRYAKLQAGRSIG